MTTWNLILKNTATGSTVLDPAPFRALTARWVLNGQGALEGEFGKGKITYSQLLPREREAVFTRNGTTIWGGYIASRGRTYRGGQFTSFQADGYFSHLRNRFITASQSPFVAVNQQTIISSLITYMNGQTDGNLGITFGTHTGSNTARSRTYCRGDHMSIADAIEEFTGFSDGIDFDLDAATKALNTWSPQRKIDKTATVIFTSSNSMDVEWTEDGRSRVSYSHAIANDECGTTLVTQSDATTITAMKRWEHVESPNTSDSTELNAAASEYLRSNKGPRMRARIAYSEAKGPAWGTFWLGDLVRIVTPDFDVSMRVMELSLSIQQPDLAFFEVIADGAIG